MATNQSRGVPTISASLIRPPAPSQAPTTTPRPPEQARPVEDRADDDGDEGQGGDTGRSRSGSGTNSRSTRRTRRDRQQETVRGHKLHLNDAVFERLQLEAIRKRTTVSAVASDILEKNLPRLRIERDS